MRRLCALRCVRAVIEGILFEEVKMKRLGVLLLGVVLFLGFLSGGAEGAIIKGRVISKSTGGPLFNANVVLERTQFGTTTDSEGKFILRGVEVGKYTLMVSVIGYEEKTARLNVVPDTVIVIDITLEPTVLPMEGIVVTATKTTKRLVDVPASVDIVRKVDIERSGAMSVDEALNTLPGVHTDRPAGVCLPVNPLATLRGTGFQSRTLVLVDGQPINEPYYRGGGVNWNAVPIASVKRVEVVKGPFSSLYGGNAVGGVINIFTEVPKRRMVDARVGVGTLDNQSYTLSYSDRFRKLGIYLLAHYKDVGGYEKYSVIKSASPGTTGIQVEGWEKTTDVYGRAKYIIGSAGRQWHKDRNLTGKLNFEVVPFSHITLFIAHDVLDKGWKGWKSYLVDSTGNVITSGTVLITDDGETKTFSVREQDFLSTHSRKVLNLLNLSSDTKIGEIMGLSFRLGLTDQWWGWARAGRTLPKGTLNYTPSRIIEGEVRGNIRLRERNVLTVGVSSRVEELTNQIWNLSDWEHINSKTTLSIESKGRVRSPAIYFQGDLKVFDQLTLFLGTRFDMWQAYDGVRFDASLPADKQTVRYPARSKSCISPKLALIYKPFPQTSLRASWGKAFRGANTNDLFRSFVIYGKRLYLANPNLNPETVTSWEIGGHHIIGRIAVIDATYFENEMKDLIYRVDLTDEEIADYNSRYGTSYTTIKENRNVGKAHTRGCELGLKQKVTDYLSLFANYAYTDSRVTECKPKPTLEGKYLIDVPRHASSVGLDIQVGHLSARFTGRYVSKQYTRDSNADTVSGVQGSRDPYFVIDTRISYELPYKIEASIIVNNVFNKNYYVYYVVPGQIVTAELRGRF